MKLLLIAFTSMLSLSSFAQDSVDFVLYRHLQKGTWGNKTREFKLAKVEMTRARYERMLSENLMMYCRITTDKDMDMIFYEGQVAVQHKRSETGKMARCEARGCKNNSFEDLSRVINEASNGTYDDEKLEGLDYSIGSVESYEDFRQRRDDYNLPEVSEIPYVTIYDPAVHGTKSPIKNSFFCFIAKLDGTYVSP